ncbi:MAG TPA: glycosyltransferase family 2 protein [Vicinamibacterales bacterium]|nr:glycosyltransferase family 2 protein [Vicinamibacterales bacterium]HOQ60390.1 glycosyltransferase family 2 protein [Vicinamibacterales bacterium]
MRTSVVIPSRNEGATVVALADAVRAHCDEVIVVDGHSTDGSPARLREAGVTVVEDGGLGKGDAIRRGLAAAGGEVIVTMDADGSHDPADIRALVAPIGAGEADLVIGCRMRGGSDEFAGTWTMFVRLWGNNFLTQVINTRFGTALTDSQNGFRAIRAAAVAQLGLRENRHSIELEMVLRALKRGLRVCQVPAHEYARKAGKSSLSVVRQTPTFLRCLLRNIW